MVVRVLSVTTLLIPPRTFCSLRAAAMWVASVRSSPEEKTRIEFSSVAIQVTTSIMHEIGHTLGYIHTQSRVDRNSYVRIISANIVQTFAANFFMWSYGTLKFPDVNLPYDFGSFMHYNALAFSKGAQPTIVALDSRYERTMGQRQAASFYDYKSINRLYCLQSSMRRERERNEHLDQLNVFSLFDDESLSTDVDEQWVSKQRLSRSSHLHTLHLSRRFRWYLLWSERSEQ